MSYEISSAPNFNAKLESLFGDSCLIRYVEDGDFQGVRFYDPLYPDEQILPTKPPSCLLADSCSQIGLNTLREFEGSVDLFGGTHTCPEDFYNILETAPQSKRIRESRFVAIEATKTDEGIQIADHPNRASFQRTELDWLRENNKTIIACERTTMPESRYDQSLRWLDELEVVIQDEPTEIIKNAIQFSLIGWRQVLRQWEIVAGLGIGIAENNVHSGRIPLIIGSWHDSSQLRFESLGVSCRVNLAEDRIPKICSFGEVFRSAMHNGQISVNDLHEKVFW